MLSGDGGLLKLKREIHIRKLWKLLLLLFVLFLAAGCRRTDDISNGQRDQIGAFLFVFDTRASTNQLVREFGAGNVPDSLVYRYDAGIVLVGGEEVPDIRELEIRDDTTIRKIYRLMSNMVIVGQSTRRVAVGNQTLEFVLEDGSIAQFHFETKNLLHMGDQNYIVEGDNQLWLLLESLIK